MLNNAFAKKRFIRYKNYEQILQPSPGSPPAPEMLAQHDTSFKQLSSKILMTKFCTFAVTCRRCTWTTVGLAGQNHRLSKSGIVLDYNLIQHAGSPIRCRHPLNPLIPIFYTIGVLCEAKNRVIVFDTFRLLHRKSKFLK